MDAINEAILALSGWFPAGSFFSFSFNLYAALAIVLVSAVCGSVGGLVVGNRMAFFSDALAHCAFAGVALGFLLCVAAGIPDDGLRQGMTLAMVGFGVAIGLVIAFVRERTGLASDTVIGVFFAFSIGLGALFTNVAAQRRRVFSIESFLFGDPLGAQAHDLVYLAILALATAFFLARCYNAMVLASVHPSLAASRGVPVRTLRYLFVVLLGVTVNLCLQVVGTLLINALLIVPAATAANLARNLRQAFWLTVALAFLSGLGGQWLSWELDQRAGLKVGIGGAIVVLSSIFFFASMAARPWVRGRIART